MPVIGSGDRDGVHILLLENPAKVFLSRRGIAHFLLHTLGELLENIAVNVADVRDAGSSLVRLECRKMRIGAPIETDDSKVEAIVRAKDLSIAPCGGSRRHRCRSHRKRIEKLASSSHLQLLRPEAIIAARGQPPAKQA